MASSANANLIVAKDGSGQFSKISDALAASVNLRKDMSRFVIYVKSGTYVENVIVTSSMANITIIGDGIDKTVVSGKRSVGNDPTVDLFSTSTFAVEGEGFLAQDTTFENTAGPDKGQAIAFGSKSDRSVCYRCSFKAYQDTLYVHSNRQFYRDCDIYGTIDFIFGNASAVIQNCNIFVRKPGPSQHCVVTAQNRMNPKENTGISIHESTFAATDDLKPVLGSIPVYLGRPWGDYSRTVVIKTTIDIRIDPTGWEEWPKKSYRNNTLYYGEYMNGGVGSNTKSRVTWPGMHSILTESEASMFTVTSLLDGNSWVSATGVPFISGL